MEISEAKLLALIDQAIENTKAQSDGNKFHQGKCHGYVKALQQVRFAITEQVDQGGLAHLEAGVSA